MKQFTVDKLFGERKVALQLFRTVQSFIENLGEVNTEITKTQVSFGTKRKFAWVWLPQLWIKNQPKNSIVLTFALDHHIENKKIKEVVEPSPGKWTHHIVIKNSSDFNDEIKSWVEEAWRKSK
jgi:hypothetical protein